MHVPFLARACARRGALAAAASLHACGWDGILALHTRGLRVDTARAHARYSSGLKLAGRGAPSRQASTPSTNDYDARSLSWSAKKELGKSASVPEISRPPRTLNLHKPVQLAQA